MDSAYNAFLENANRYVHEKSIRQIEELVEKYEPDLMWFDTPHKLPLYQNIFMTKRLREFKPDVVINGRLARWDGHQLGDYENSGDRAAFFFPTASKYWESIPTTNESDGYSITDRSHKPASHFIRLLASAASKGGNILLNVGPMGSGKWDSADVAIFDAIGAWMDTNGESIYGTERTNDIPIPNWGVITKKGSTLYLHVHQWPSDGVLWLGSLEADIQGAKILATGEAVACSQQGKDIKIIVPVSCPDPDSTVIVLTLNGNYKAHPQRLLDPHAKNELHAFDAVLTGIFSRGDGKPGNNFLSGWKSNDQYLTWNVSLRERGTFGLSLVYNGSGNTGTVSIEINGTGVDLGYSGSNVGSTVSAGQVTLDAGDHVIRLRGKTLNGEHLRPRTLILEPPIQVTGNRQQ
jgi:hypothetical protein